MLTGGFFSGAIRYEARGQNTRKLVSAGIRLWTQR
jgi:hypothetical protein